MPRKKKPNVNILRWTRAVEGEKKNETEVVARGNPPEASTSSRHPEIVFNPDVEDRERIKEDRTVADGTCILS